MRIENHRLIQDDGTAVPFHPTENWNDKVIQTRWLVMHYTAGGSAAESINWMSKNRGDESGSAHLVISKTGQITQMVPFNKRAWHAGTSRWKDKEGLNGYSIGIELDNQGLLDGGPGNWKFKGTRVPDENVQVATHKNEPDKPNRGWAKYPQVQLDVALKVAKLLVQHYGLEDVIGHDDISPGRKQDPGPAFDMAGFRASAMGQTGTGTQAPAPSGARFRVKTTLNVRSGPGSSNPTVAGSPLPPDSYVRGQEDRDGWKRIAAEGSGVSGWVSAQYLEAVSVPLFTATTTLNIRSGPSGGDAPVAGSPLPAGTVVEGLQDQGDWKRVSVQGTVNGRTGITGWVSAKYLQPAVIPVNGIGQPAET